MKQELPNKFGLVLDGWKGPDNCYYIGIYANYHIDGVRKMPLLSLLPPVDERDHGGASHKETISDTLDWYGKSLVNVSHLVSDNCNTMRALARDHLKCPFIGCYAHKLNLAIKNWLGLGYYKVDSPAHQNRTDEQVRREYLLDKVRAVTVDLRTMLNTAHLRELMRENFVQPILNQETRWTSIHSMVKRFIRLEPTIWEMKNLTILNKMPDSEGMNEIRELGNQLEWLNEFMIAFQTRDLNLANARDLYDAILRKFPDMNFYLSDDASIILDNDFDNGLIKVLRDEERTLTEREKRAIEHFELDLTEEDRNDVDIEILSATEVLELSRKKQKLVKTKYDVATIQAIPATSCDAERLFSKCGLVMSKLRCAMLNKSFESRIILMENKEYWSNLYKDPRTCRLLVDSKGFRMMQEILTSKQDQIEQVDNTVDVDHELM